MPRFEVQVPAAAAPAAGPTVRVEADHWLGALKAALGAGQLPSNLLCDVRPDGVDVTDAKGGGVFRIRELRPAPETARPAAPAPEPRAAAPAPPRPSRAEDVLAELFERTGALDRGADRASGLGFLLDLAMEKVACEAGSVLLSRLGARELEFAVVRGPRSQEILRLGLTVPEGRGVVGFCVREDVAAAVADAATDPRFHAAISRAIGAETRSILCAPIARGGQVLGAIELINKRGGRAFDAVDLAVVSYLAHAAAGLLERAAR